MFGMKLAAHIKTKKMERRKFAASMSALLSSLLVVKSMKVFGQIPDAKKSFQSQDPFSGEKVSFTKVSGIRDIDCDDVIYRKIGNEYFKRDFDGDINVQWFGAKGDGITDDTDAFNKAFASLEKKTIYVPSTKNGYLIKSTITIPNNKNLLGDGKGNGINTRTKINFSGSGILFNVLSYYVTLRDLHIVSTTNNSVDNTAFYLPVTQTMMENVTIDGFRTGVKNSVGKTTFAHYFRNVMISGCGTGVEFNTANNITFEACFFNSNDLSAKLNTCTQVSFSNGTVMQIMGNLKTGFRRSEEGNSKIFDINNSRAITFRDCYFEVGAATTTANNQKIGTLSSVAGFNFNGNYCIGSYRPDQPPLIDIADDGCLAINITGNTFLRMGKNTYVLGTSGTGTGKQYGAIVSGNRLSGEGMDKDISFIPKLEVKDSNTQMKFSTQIGYCSLEGNTVYIFGTLTLTNKGNQKGPLSITAFPLPMRKGLNSQSNLIGNLSIKNMTTQKGGKYIEMSTGNNSVELNDENGNPIMAEDISNTSTINFSISYPFAQNIASGT